MAATPPAKNTKNASTSRAVIRPIEAGCMAECPYCQERVKFRARHRDDQVICNVYENGLWQRVEQFHRQCYDEAGQPHGEPYKSEGKKRGKKSPKQ